MKKTVLKLLAGIAIFLTAFVLSPMGIKMVEANEITWVEINGQNCSYSFESTSNGLIIHFRADNEDAVLTKNIIQDLVSSTDNCRPSRFAETVDNRIIGIVFDKGTYKIKSSEKNFNEWFKNYESPDSYTDYLLSIDLSGLNFKNIQKMNSMFEFCYVLKGIVWGDVDTSAVYEMKEMFNGCLSITELDLSGFSDVYGIDMNRMFLECSELKTIYVSGKWKIDAGNANYFTDTFGFDNKLVGGNGTTNVNATTYLYNYNALANIDGIDGKEGLLTLKGCQNCTFIKDGDELTIKALGNNAAITKEALRGMFDYYYKNEGIKKVKFDKNKFDRIKIDDCEELFYHSFMSDEECTLESIDLSGLDTSNATSMRLMFGDCHNLKELVLGDYFDTSKVENMQSMFKGCCQLKKLDLSIFETHLVTTMNSMFADCTKLEEIVFGNGFGTYYVEKMSAMFSGCEALESIDLSSFDTLRVEEMGYMFSRCYKLKELDLFSFNTMNVTSTAQMFGNEGENDKTMSLERIIVSDQWNIDANADEVFGNAMFAGCENLVGGNGTKCNGKDNISCDYACIDDASMHPGYLTGKYEILYDLNNGMDCDIPAETVYQSELVKNQPNDPTMKGYSFLGWYTSKDCKENEKWDFSNCKVTKSMTLFAKWVKDTTPNEIDAKDITKAYKTKKQTIKLNATAKGGATLTYISDTAKIKVDEKGVVTIPAKWMGVAVITITSEKTADYLVATKNVTITVSPAKINISSASLSKKGILKLTWKANKAVDGYEITYSTSKKFKDAKTVTVKGGSKKTASIKKLSAKKTYYVKFRAFKKGKSGKAYSAYSSTKKVKFKK